MSMITNVYFVPTLLGALGNTYATGSYVRTLGFATIGDGGAAMYEISSETVSGASSYTIAGTPFNYGGGKFYTSSSAVFQLLPSNGKVYAEQFGVLPNNDSLASTNVNLLGKAVDYVASKGYTLTFASKGTYYLAPITITVPSNLFLDGNGATLHVIGGTDGGIGFFNSSSQVNNVTIKSVNLIGRNTYKDCPQQDQAFHIKATNFTLKDVNMKQFNFGIHSYGAYPENNKDYEIPEIVNKNWLLENCTISDTVTGLCLSEIDGITLKNCSITSDYTTSKKDHCIYLNSNCINVRVVDTNLGEITGDAFHKAFNPQGDKDNGKPIRRDISKNIFLNDVSIHNADSALVLGIISENIMCDNVYVTYAKVALQLSSADNLIISNSNLNQTQNVGDCSFLYIEDACKCWLQNTHIHYSGHHRVAASLLNTSEVPKVYNRIVSANKKHRRNYIGADFDINNYNIKLTGCDIESTYNQTSYYFEAFMSGNNNEWVKAAVTEYWDNCTVNLETGDNMFRLKCINDISTGLTIRNSYFYNDYSYNQSKALFKLHCDINNCNCCTSDACAWKVKNKRFPWLHIENVVFDNAGYWGSSSWNHIINPHTPTGTIFTLEDAVKVSGSYAANCYKITNGQKTEMKNLMG